MSHMDGAPPDTDSFDLLATEQCISLTTYRRDGTAVPTPVWVAPSGGALVVWTGIESGKVKRLRHTPAVTVAPCERGGSLLDEPVPAHARVMRRDELPAVRAAMKVKYGWQFRFAALGAGIGRLIGLRPGQIGVELTLD